MTRYDFGMTSSSIAFVGPVDLLPSLQQCTDELMVSYSVGHVRWMLASKMRPTHNTSQPLAGEAEEQTHGEQQGNGLVKEIVPHVRLD